MQCGAPARGVRGGRGTGGGPPRKGRGVGVPAPQDAEAGRPRGWGRPQRGGEVGAWSGDESDRAFLRKRKVPCTQRAQRRGKDGVVNAVWEGASVAGAESGRAGDHFPEHSFIHSVGAQEASPQW